MKKLGSKSPWKCEKKEMESRLLSGKQTADRSWEYLMKDIEDGAPLDIPRIVCCLEQCNKWDTEISDFKYKNATH